MQAAQTFRRSPRVAFRPQSRLSRYISRFDAGETLRSAIYGMLAGVIALVALEVPVAFESEAPALRPMGTPAAPISRAAPQPREATSYTAPPAESSIDPLLRPMQLDLKANGVVELTGLIEPGSARRIREKFATVESEVKTVSLNSPGGSIEDAIAIARMLRERGVATQVADGAICISSCPLLFAGGVTRKAAEGATFGVHQFYAETKLSQTDPAQAMSDAQLTIARIARYLTEMGVEAELWLHALDTPPQSLYHLSRDELVRYALVTETSN